MVRGSKKEPHGSRENLQAKSKKKYNAIKKTEKKLRAQYQNTENIYEKAVIIERIKFIKEHITDTMKENRSRRIIEVMQQIKSNVDNGEKKMGS